jgi:hypothetical protein
MGGQVPWEAVHLSRQQRMERLVELRGCEVCGAKAKTIGYLLIRVCHAGAHAHVVCAPCAGPVDGVPCPLTAAGLACATLRAIGGHAGVVAP